QSNELTFNQQANLNGSFYTGGVKHQVLLGADVDESRAKNYTFNIYATPGSDKPSTAYDVINVFDPNSYKSREDEPRNELKLRTTTDIYRYGVFAQDLVSLTDQFKVMVGLRYTRQIMKEAEA